MALRAINTDEDDKELRASATGFCAAGRWPGLRLPCRHSWRHFHSKSVISTTSWVVLPRASASCRPSCDQAKANI